VWFLVLFFADDSIKPPKPGGNNPNFASIRARVRESSGTVNPVLYGDYSETWGNR
jgi:hypothetical protein